jgi:hypothetical protein
MSKLFPCCYFATEAGEVVDNSYTAKLYKPLAY